MLYVTGCRVRGQIHYTRNVPNQDAMIRVSHAGEMPINVVALADGHGSAKCFRSHIGASAAVNSVIATAFSHLAFNPALSSDYVQTVLPIVLVDRWTASIADYHLGHPFTDEEWQTFVRDGCSQTFREALLCPLVAYGTTVLAAIVTSCHLIYMQLGDGEILEVGQAGEVRKIFDKAEIRLGDETDSLCLSGAARRLSIALYAREDHPFKLIMLSTDGYSKSFKTDQDFQKVATDMAKLSVEQGMHFIEQHLEEWLLEATFKGSGDDIACGLIVQCEDSSVTRGSDTDNGRQRTQGSMGQT